MYLIGFYSKKNLYKLNKFDYYKKSFEELKRDGVNIIYFYEEDNSIILDQEIVNGIRTMGVELIGFKNESDIVDYIKKLSGKIFINTFEEQEINFTNKIRKLSGQKITNDPEMFLNKYLQRKIIGEKYPETVVQYKKVSIEEAKRITKNDLPPLPCIIKPTGGVQSSGVCKIESYEQYDSALKSTLESFKMLENKKLLNQEILIEEFIDGKMYTIDYYIDEEQNIILSKPVFVKIGLDYRIDDFCNISRFISNEVEAEVDKNKLDEFIKKTVIGGRIINTFIHHEFKINSKGEFKTIEINGRIGGFRLDMYFLGYSINLLKFPFESKTYEYPLKNNIAMFALYPGEEGLFVGYNSNIIEKISSLKSFHRINTGIKKINDPIGLTKNGYGKVGSIELSNINFDEFKKDVEYIEKIYFNIININ